MESRDLRDQLAVERTRLANERTLLAYVRTGLALSAAGAAVIHVLPAQALLRLAGWVFVAAGALTIAGGFYRFQSVRKTLQ